MKTLWLMLFAALTARGMDYPTAVRHAEELAVAVSGKAWGVRNTGSMLPALTPASVVVVAPVDYKQVQLGDIVVFTRAQDGAEVAHRVVRIDRFGRLWTKGDSARHGDGVLTADRLRGRVVAVFHAELAAR